MMIASESSIARLTLNRAVHLLLGGDEYLCEFIFHHREDSLRLSVTELLDEVEYLEVKDQLLIRIALDFWSGAGGCRLDEVLRNFDDETILLFIRSLLALRGLSIEELLC